ncbi:MAG: 23S rRNA (pseudouridine(1915)-N(3))-methyltransferase RlmH [Polyangiales bacterium]
MRIAIVAVGKIKQAGLRAELDDYLGRIRRYASCDEVELKDAPDRELVPRFERALKPRATLVALEVDGRAFDSAGLARWLGRHEQSGTELAFLVGGAYGLPETVSKRAVERLSLSKLTLPHRLARVVLAEQLYRAFTILRNEPYSH